MSEILLSDPIKKLVEKMQIDEITEYYIYSKVAKGIKNDNNRKVLEKIANEEKAHSYVWKKYTNKEAKPKNLKVFWYVLISRILGFTFALKLLEKGEEAAGINYVIIAKEIPKAKEIADDEDRHEKELLGLLDEEKLKYVGSMVLGLNDALVELTGTLAGLSLAIQNTRIIALSGLITGISATLSMASSEFLSARSEGRKDALKSCTYTGIAYLFTVIILILPFLLLPPEDYLVALGIMIASVVLIIAGFNYYISIAKDLKFKRRFLEMTGISLGVAVISFGIGILVKKFLGIDI
ncbi:VIT1/CCC1 transporter family protein [Clostridium intestinale]|uniref:Predicted Fe2+/Mn2+ transporter, VIT1/CCC1 family n=1 Tax=Clostridium intestinale DSM 6191 TaxID=1121320 RepID=A0A1M6F9X7_9CLOT|nr:VIT1/CCC1 transporter family protein [Clostridium intestinale]SHI94456.1 Predicted Fe2+/Mn2+ transporter, VIT1/CCC1 family [Clostridium intestinale DSM 6191]